MGSLYNQLYTNVLVQTTVVKISGVKETTYYTSQSDISLSGFIFTPSGSEYKLACTWNITPNQHSDSCNKYHIYYYYYNVIIIIIITIIIFYTVITCYI